MRAALVPDALDVYPPDLIEPLRDEAARALGRERDDSFEVVGTEGAQAGLSLALLAAIDPGDEVILGDPGYFHLPAAVLAAGGVPVTVADRPRQRLSPGPRRRGGGDHAAHAGDLPRRPAATPTAPLATADEVAALTALAERHGLLLIHDVTHGAAGHRARRAARWPRRRASTRWRPSRSRTASGWPARAWASWPGRRPSCAAACSSRRRSRG